MVLSDTVDLMLSDNYKDRFVAEYAQTKIRYEKLHRSIIKIESGLQKPVNCDLKLMKDQASAMGQYLYVLEIRALKENIDLYGEF